MSELFMSEQQTAQVFRTTPRYVQAPGLIERSADYLAPLKVKRCAVLCTPRSQKGEGARLLAALDKAGIDASVTTFGGECSFQEIEARTAELREQGQLDALIALGGGKTLDAGKCIAERLEVPVVIMPTLASNDAPCSALSVIYTPEGATETYEVFAQNPALVMVDTAIVAQAPVRFLVAGMGDAMSTWYEARACHTNPAGMSPYGDRPTLAGVALSQTCADILYAHGVDALEAVKAGQLNAAVEHVVEANTLLSGAGFECTGVAGAHALAQALTLLPEVDHNYLHGEMVAIGTLTQLMLEQDRAEAQRCARLFAQVGLPINFAQLRMSLSDEAAVNTLIEATLAFPFIANMAVEVTADSLRQAFAEVERQGNALIAEMGDQPYGDLHG
ncbi:glycerol dehydrogenase [Marinobacterium mangrovicola]|uniref:Glycerol dehydrogenase n=1 Tax=Marinobacterium mangrovicola TaxID=1476959 RepID=A0A4V6ND23_9GAMM|nr:glycerol dehydrogenase [Marinobacterium mangrovicola]TCK09086.1 glycerol dehydrogenase [Marinobacterium mangrovicola]